MPAQCCANQGTQDYVTSVNNFKQKKGIHLPKLMQFKEVKADSSHGKAKHKLSSGSNNGSNIIESVFTFCCQKASQETIGEFFGNGATGIGVLWKLCIKGL